MIAPHIPAQGPSLRRRITNARSIQGAHPAGLEQLDQVLTGGDLIENLRGNRGIVELKPHHSAIFVELAQHLDAPDPSAIGTSEAGQPLRLGNSIARIEMRLEDIEN